MGVKLRTVIVEPSITVELPNGMRVTIRDSGPDGQPMITVRQPERDLLDGAPSGPDVPRYAPGGEYEFSLPDAYIIAERCDQRAADPASADFPAEGYATITVTHRH